MSGEPSYSSYRLQMIGKCPKVVSISNCCLIAGSLYSDLFGRKSVFINF